MTDALYRGALSCFLMTLLWAVPTIAADTGSSQGWEEVEARKKADVAAQLLVRRLTDRLTAALHKGRPLKAMDVCKTVAREVSVEMSHREGIAIRRTALRLRNSDNRPDDFERKWLEQAQRSLAVGEKPNATYEVVRNDSGCELRHVRPLWFTADLCSQCHGRGAEIGDDVRAFLRKRYPHDQATGFAPGELQGAISVRVALREPCRDPEPLPSH